MRLFPPIFPEFDFGTAGAARTHYGKAGEEVACNVLGLLDITINSRYSVNFDAFKGPMFYEIKNVRKGGKVVVYKFRMEKELRWAEDGVLDYVMVVHNVRGAKTNRELWEGFERNGVSIVVIPAKKLHKIAKGCELRHIEVKGNGAGYEREGYREGYYNVPIKDLVEGGYRFVGGRCISIYGFKIKVEVIRYV